MTGHPVCPRCGDSLREPSAWDTAWHCAAHGAVPPLRGFGQPSVAGFRLLAAQSAQPVWLPWPLPHGWVYSGAGYAGDDAVHASAVVVAASGPGPLGGPGELLLIAEEPGVGLAARYAGMPGADPGETFGRGVPGARILLRGRPTSLWCADAPSRAAYAGEADGIWLWLVLDPPDTAAMLMDDLRLTDARDLGEELELLPCGSLSPLLG